MPEEPSPNESLTSNPFMSGDEGQYEEDSGEEFESYTSDTIYQTTNDDTEDLTSGTLENK